MRFLLVRHAESLPRENMSHAEGLAVGLSSFGRFQARTTSQGLKRKGIATLVSSPLTRCTETSEIISRAAGVSYELNESFGEFAPHPGIKGREFKEAKSRARKELEWKLEGGESVAESARRFRQGLVSLLHAKKAPIAVISHALIMQNFLTVYCKSSLFPYLSEASVTVVDYDEKTDSFSLVSLNEQPSILKVMYLIRRKAKRLGIWD